MSTEFGGFTKALPVGHQFDSEAISYAQGPYTSSRLKTSQEGA